MWPGEPGHPGVHMGTVWCKMHGIKEKSLSDALKIVRLAVFRAIAIRVGTTAMQLYCGVEIGLNSNHSVGKWECIAREQGGVRGWKSAEGKRHG